ncbi:FixH family protein [Formosa sp. L2A11]|uniref:FixH family protein n=1 Tax=Formosa sp. L2A11 TaxID=2686363 RepID=UPI00131BE2B9|nr:FixH family protein [Formosa sp. L2A11]
MRINWGTGIVIAFGCFITFILYLVINMMTDKEYHHDMVVDDYYKKELTLQSDINKEENALKLDKNVTWSHTDNGILIQFPNAMNVSEISGTVSLYRPSNKTLDFDLPITLSNHTLLIPKDKLVNGRWDLTIDWKNNDTSYLYKKSLVY